MTEPAAMTIGQRIARERKRLGLSQEALGEALGVSRQAISKWEADASLPEIDKLIAMARCFGVTVGWLLGVEESREEDGPGGAEPSVNSETEARAQALLERCLEALPAGGAGKLPRKIRRALIAGGAAVALCLALLLGRIGALQGQLRDVNENVSQLHDQIYSMQVQMDGVSDLVSQQVQDALESEYGLLASWELSLESVDYDGGRAVLRLEGVPKTAVSDPAEISFTARMSSGEVVSAQETELDGHGGFVSRISLVIRDGIEYYIRIGEETMLLNWDYTPYSDLSSAVSLSISASETGASVGADGVLSGTVELNIVGPELFWDGRPKALGQVRLWSVVDGQRWEELSLEDVSGAGSSAPAALEGTEEYWDYGTYIAGYEIDPEAAGMLPGSQCWVEFEVDYGGGVWSGQGDALWSWDGTAWTPG